MKFCGNGYQLILSRRAPNIRNGQEDLWGFALVREWYEPGFKAESYQYCVVDGEVPSIPYEPLKFFLMEMLLKVAVLSAFLVIH